MLLSYSKTFNKAQSFSWTFENTHKLNPIYFLNFYIYFPEFISCMKPLLLQKQPACLPHCSADGCILELLEAMLPTCAEKEASKEKARLRDENEVPDDPT